MGFELEKIATAIGGEGNGFEMERISEAVENGAGGSGGTGGGILVVNITYDSYDIQWFDKTWKQINDATFAVAVFSNPMGSAFGKVCAPIISTQITGNTYSASVLIQKNSSVQIIAFNTDSEDGYPAYEQMQ